VYPYNTFGPVASAWWAIAITGMALLPLCHALLGYRRMGVSQPEPAALTYR